MKYNMRRLKKSPALMRNNFINLRTNMDQLSPGECVEVVCDEVSKRAEHQLRSAVMNYSKKCGKTFKCNKSRDSDCGTMKFFVTLMPDEDCIV
tara:strand:- start:4844 stop:5122 length:279 start_codon:yes stop_codon:yes gene_type:complete